MAGDNTALKSPEEADKEALSNMMDGIEIKATSSTTSSTTIAATILPDDSNDDETRGRLRTPKPKLKKKPSSAEKCIVKSRRIHPLHLRPLGKIEDVFCDGSISNKFARSLISKVVSVSIHSASQSGGGMLTPEEGHGGFVSLPGFTEAQFVTAAHNKMSGTRTLENEQQPYICRYHDITNAEGKDDFIQIPETGSKTKEDVESHFLRDGAYWSHGIDKSIGPGISDTCLAVNAFDAVGNGFVYKVGMKIGMVTLSSVGAQVEDALIVDEDKAEDSLVDEDTAEDAPGVDKELAAKGRELSRIYGQPGEVNVYTGEITAVGDEFFEHDVNTFPGLSGAIIFLLDQQQPECVAESDYKKAIGVHAGYCVTFERNIAFKLLEQRKSWWQKCFGCLRSIASGRS